MYVYVYVCVYVYEYIYIYIYIYTRLSYECFPLGTINVHVYAGPAKITQNNKFVKFYLNVNISRKN